MTRLISKTVFKFTYTKHFSGNNLVKSMSIMAQEQIIDVRGQIINYVKVGNGNKSVLCFPGALGTIWSDFKPQIEGLDRQKLTLIVMDPPGYGNSRPPNRTFSRTFYEEDADVAYNFMMKLGIRKFSILGWRGGGTSSLIMAGKHPENIEKLIIWGAGAYLLPKEIQIYKEFRDIKKWSNEMKGPLIEAYTEKGLETMWSTWCDAVAKILIEGGDICKYCLKNIKCPTLILYGEQDQMLAAEHPHYLFSHINNAKLYKFSKGKHNIHKKYAEKFNAIVMNFLFNTHCTGISI